MESDSHLLLYLVLLVVLVLVNAFFSMSEIAVITLNDNRLRKLAGEGNKKANILLTLTGKPSRFLATIQVGVTLSGLLASALSADLFARRLASFFFSSGIRLAPPIFRVAALVVVTLALSFFTLVFGELVPKRIAMQHCERISLAVARPLALLHALGRPFVLLLSATTNGVLRLLGMDPHRQPERVTEEEIRMMIDVGEETGSIEQSEKDMINNIFEFDDRAAEDIMSHRTEITAVELGASLEEVVRAAKESGYSRIPVYDDDLDSIVGILYVKDLLELAIHPAREGFELSRYMREPLYVPESANCQLLLKEFKDKKIQMAVVIDEYGGTSGLITMEDLLEAIVGNIQDEYDDEEEDITPFAENRYLVDGLTPLDQVAKYFELKIPDEDDFDTIGGYLVNRLGHIPEEEEYPSITVGEFLFTIREMDDRRVAKVEAERLLAVEQEAGASSDSP